MIVRQLNPQAIVIEDCETELRVLLWSKYLNGYEKYQFKDSVDRVIKKALRKLKSEELIKASEKSLYQFADKLWAFMINKFGWNGKAVKDTIGFINGVKKQVPKEFALPIMGMKPKAVDAYFDYETQEMGVPNDIYMKDYMRQVKDSMKEMSNINALDPDDDSHRNSLRNKAEMVVRQEYHENQIKDLKAKGVRLVVCSSHQDCSDRCANWQGRVYSLDHTKGKTEDGREYVPLEVATDIFVTTKSGKTWKNGLLGFNCRHRLYEYKVGMQIPNVSTKTRIKQDKINQKQRYYERQIREAKTNALEMQRAGMRDDYLKYRKKAIELNKKYIAFSQANDRAYYPDRCKIFD